MLTRMTCVMNATLEFSDLSDYSVQCLNDLPTECDGTVTANRGVVSCGVAVNQKDGRSARAPPRMAWATITPLSCSMWSVIHG